MSISYELKIEGGKSRIRVRLGRRLIGDIRAIKGGGYHYVPTGGQPGETFSTVSEVKRSIEGSGQ